MKYRRSKKIIYKDFNIESSFSGKDDRHLKKEIKKQKEIEAQKEDKRMRELEALAGLRDSYWQRKRNPIVPVKSHNDIIFIHDGYSGSCNNRGFSGFSY